MLQETTNVPAAGGSNAAALQQMGFADMIQHMDAVGWVVLITLLVNLAALGLVWLAVLLLRLRLAELHDRCTLAEYVHLNNTAKA